MYTCAKSQGDQRLSKHSTLPHNHGILYRQRSTADNEHNAKVFESRPIKDVVVSVEYGTCKDEAGEDTKLNGLVHTIPYAVDAEANVEE